MGPIPQTTSRDRRNSDTRSGLLHRVRAEFSEMPGLRLTCGQAQRLFDMRADVCERVLAALVKEGMLARSTDDRYGVPDELGWRTPRAS